MSRHSSTELQEVFPGVLARAGKAACFAADEFFRAWLSNAHTRTAYAHQVGRFLVIATAISYSEGLA